MPVFRPEYSDEAWTLDYLSPAWYPYWPSPEARREGAPEGATTFATKEEAEAFVATQRAECSDSFRCFRVREVPTKEEAAAAREEQYRYEAEVEAKTPRKGRTVTVVAGRKVPRGTTGEVFWYGEGKQYGYPSRWNKPPMRVGFKDAEGEVHWTDASNVEVTGWEAHLPAEYREGVTA